MASRARKKRLLGGFELATSWTVSLILGPIVIYTYRHNLSWPWTQREMATSQGVTTCQGAGRLQSSWGFLGGSVHAGRSATWSAVDVGMGIKEGAGGSRRGRMVVGAASGAGNAGNADSGERASDPVARPTTPSAHKSSPITTHRNSRVV